MATYQTSAGDTISLKAINAGTFRRAKKDESTEWMADLTLVLEGIDDPIRLSDLIAFHSGLSVDVIDSGLSGESFKAAQDAIVKLYEDFYPGLKGRLLSAIEKLRAEAQEKVDAYFKKASSTPESAG